jgi:CRP-like cAMP-binding protein
VTRRIRHARQFGIDVSSLVPLMRQATWQPGHRLFDKGDEARHLYVVIEGTVRIPEHDVEIGSGSLLGEMGIFVPGCRRTASAVCVTQCQLGSLSYEEVERIYFQKPEFGLALISLLATRFNDNERKLRLRLEA